jgi:GT2 family glycosyltransferase
MTGMQISIIIPTKDRGAVFNETLCCAVDAIQHLHGEIIVVNDSTTSQPSIPENFKNVKLINNPKAGVASARNAGVKQSTGSLLLFLDDDIIISRHTLDHVMKVHEEMDKLCLNVNWEYPTEVQQKLKRTQFGRFMLAHRLTSFKGWYADPSWRDDALFLSRSVASFHLSISRENFLKTKGYNETFPHAGFEDYDFPLQLKEAGLMFFIDSRVTVFHNEADRLKLQNWLNSQERRAATRSVAVNLGYNELKLKYNIFKKATLTNISFFFQPLFAILNLIPNKKSFDPLYFKLVALMQASKIYKGYSSH